MRLFRFFAAAAFLAVAAVAAKAQTQPSAVADSNGQSDSASLSDSGAAVPPAHTGAPSDSVSEPGLELEEKRVRGKTTRAHREKEVSRIRLRREDIRKVAAVQGDPMRVLATLPGTTNQNDFNVRPFVRGGKAEETQVLWEGIPLIQPYHFGSIYSIFNVESLEDLTFHSGGFPVEMGNALSGALFMRARPAPLDSLALSADLSLLRGNAYAGVPLWKDKLGVSFAYQAFWYDWVFNRGLDLVDLVNDEEEFEGDKKQIRTNLDLPNFKDLQIGLSWKVSEKLSGDYSGLVSRDIFSIKEPRTLRLVNGREVSPNYHEWNLFFGSETDVRETRRELDTFSQVAVENEVHGIRFHWKPSEDWSFRQTLAYQGQEWDVGFYDKVAWFDSIAPDGGFAGRMLPRSSDYSLDIDREAFDWRFDGKGDVGEDLVVRLGAAQSLRESGFASAVPRTYFEAIVNGNADAYDILSYFNPDGYAITKSNSRFDSTRGDYPNYLEELPKVVRIDGDGDVSSLFSSAYVSGEYAFDPAHRLTLGLRGEADNHSDRPFLSPRAAYFQSLGPRDELTLASGLYSQSDFPFQIRIANPSLRPEKAFHFNVEWTHVFSPRYRLESQVYQKNYYDLVVPALAATGRLDWESELLYGIDSAQYNNKPAALDSLIALYGERRLIYRNGGTGKAAGAEISFFYDPNPTWKGWFSAEAGYSKRRDSTGQRSYDFRYHRPWAFNWVNTFRLPGRFELGFRGRFAAGLPYTGFVSNSGFEPTFPGSGFSEVRERYNQSDTLLAIGPRNGKRYSPYSRWDLRLARDFSGTKHAWTAYFEVWNAFNSPNFLLSDAETRQWKFVDFNYPFPILFLGISGRW